MPVSKQPRDLVEYSNLYIALIFPSGMRYGCQQNNQTEIGASCTECNNGRGPTYWQRPMAVHGDQKINDKDRNMKIISNSLHAHSSKVVGVCSRGAIPYNHCAKPNRAPSIPYALLCYLCFIK